MDAIVGHQQAVTQPDEKNSKSDWRTGISARVRPFSGKITFHHNQSYGFIQGSYLSQPDKTSPQPPQNRRKRGSNGLPRAGKELIEDGLVYLWQLSKSLRFALVFWTVTIPTHYQDGSEISDGDHKLLLTKWPIIVRRIFEELTRLYRRRQIPEHYLYVTEPQEERFLGKGVFAPHLHAVMANRWNAEKRNPYKDKGFMNSGFWEVTTEETDEIVERILSNALGRPVDCRSACQLESIKGLKGLFFYLTKLGKIGRYISKGSKLLREMAEAGWEEYFPPNWYGCDRNVRQTVRDSVQTYDLGETSLSDIRDGLRRESLEFQFENDRPLFRDFYMIQPEECDFPVAMVVRVSQLRDIEAGIDAILNFDRSIVPVASGKELLAKAC